MPGKKPRPTMNDHLDRLFHPDGAIAFLDAEFNAGMNPHTREKTSEIISVGIIICDRDYNELKKYYTLVSPATQKRVFPMISNITGITTEMLEGQPSFAEMSAAVTELVKEYGIKKIYTWGASDKHSLLLEKDEWKARKLTNHQSINKWSSYMELCTDISGYVSGQMLGIRGGLTVNMENLMFFCGIDQHQEHNALSDANYLYQCMRYLKGYYPQERQDEEFRERRELLAEYYQDRSLYNSFRRFRSSSKGCDLYRKWGKAKYADDIRLKAFEDDMKFLKGEIPYDMEFDTIQEYFSKN
jgi:hypothetical protein